MFAANVPPMPTGQTDQAAWNSAFQKGWIVDATLPLTVVTYPDQVMMTPACDKTVTCTFSRRMVACPLTLNGPPGSEPNGKANWWQQYFSTSATGHAKRAWVQGHLLNHHIHGPGVPDNLVPITDELNRIMEKWAEKFIKDEVLAKKKILWYQVTVHWLCGSKVGSVDWLGNATKHPGQMEKIYDGHKKGECLAPTCLQWEAAEVAWDANTQSWKGQSALQFGGYGGIENGIFPNSWNS